MGKGLAGNLTRALSERHHFPCGREHDLYDKDLGLCNKDLGLCHEDLGLCDEDLGLCDEDLGLCDEDLGLCCKYGSNSPWCLSDFAVTLMKRHSQKLLRNSRKARGIRGRSLI